MLYFVRTCNPILCKVKSETTVNETSSCPRGAILEAWSHSEWGHCAQEHSLHGGDGAPELAIATDCYL